MKGFINMRILAVDYGEVRTGLAISDYTGTIASPLTVLHDRNLDMLVGNIVKIANENEADEIVVGLPINMNGTKGEKSIKCEKVAEKIREASNMSVSLWDERLTTVSAHEIISENNPSGKNRRKKRQKTVDAVAAAVILEGYLNSKG
jgi:putative Holliday junction resolvase